MKIGHQRNSYAKQAEIEMSDTAFTRHMPDEDDLPLQQSDRVPVPSCPVCGGEAFRPKYTIGPIPIESCAGCGLVLQNPQPSDQHLNEIYGPNYFLFSEDDPAAMRQFEVVKRATARLQLAELSAYLEKGGRRPAGLRLLEIGCGHGNFLYEARAAGYQVHGLDYSSHAAAAANRKLGVDAVRTGPSPFGLYPAKSFDVCVLADVIEHVRDPRQFLTELLPLLDDDGVVFLATPDLGSLSSKIWRTRWFEYKLEHLYYFTKTSIRRLLEETGFSRIEIHNSLKVLTADYVFSHFERYPGAVSDKLIKLARRLVPGRLLRMNVKISASGLCLFATKH